MPERMSGNMSDRVTERMPEDLPDRLPQDIWQMPERLSGDTAEKMPERMPEDLQLECRKDFRLSAETCACLCRHLTRLSYQLYNRFHGETQPQMTTALDEKMLGWMQCSCLKCNGGITPILPGGGL